MKRTLWPAVTCCLGALLIACGGGGDDKGDNLGVTISAVPTRSAEALGDFATLTPVPTLSAPSQTPSPLNTPVPPAPAVQPQAPIATATPQPAPAAAAATPALTVFGTPRPGDTFTQSAPPAAGSAGCPPAGAMQAGPGGQQGMILNGAPPPGGPPPQTQGGGPASQALSAGIGGVDPMAGLAGFLNISTAQLQAELSQKGATQASIAARHGKSRDQLKAFLIEQMRKQTAEAVAKGQMTQAQASQMVTQFSADIDKVIDGSAGCGPITFAPGPAR